MAALCTTAQELVRPELASVDDSLRRLAESDVELLAAACRHVLDSGGKRIRPALVALSARAANGRAGGADPMAALMGAAVETVHVASLLHDDVVDGAELRRGRRSVNAQWGASVSIFAADYLF